MSDMPMKIVHVRGLTFYVCIGFLITLYVYNSYMFSYHKLKIQKLCTKKKRKRKFRKFNVSIYFSWIPIHSSQAN